VSSTFCSVFNFYVIYVHYFFCRWCSRVKVKGTEEYLLREFQKFQQIGWAMLVENKIRQSGHVFKRCNCPRN
jgi:hypothetical protein